MRSPSGPAASTRVPAARALNGGVLLAFSVVLATALASTTDPDLFWHLRTGDVIVNHGLPVDDIFSFTVPEQAWVTHEWLSQVFLWVVWSAAGNPGLILSFAAITVSAFVIAFRSSAAPAGTTSAVTALAALSASVSTGVRPQMFNLVGVALVVLFCERVRRGHWPVARLWWLPAIVMLWANLHSGFFLGLAVMAVYVIGETVQRRGSDPRPTLDRFATNRLALVGGLSFLGAVVNPNGPKLWLYPFETLGSPAMRDFIVEWHSPNFHRPAFWPFALLLAVAAVVAGATRPTLRHTQALLLLGTGLASLQSMRHIGVFAIVAIPAVSEPLATLVAERRAARPVHRPSPILGLLSAALGLVVAALFTIGIVGGNDEAVAESYPVAAVDWLEANGYDLQPGFNSYGWGGYLIWRDFPVYIDGRADVYGDAFMERYAVAYRGEEGWREPLDDYKVTWTLLSPGSDLAVLLAEAPEWVEAYRDDQAIIFIRRSP